MYSSAIICHLSNSLVEFRTLFSDNTIWEFKIKFEQHKLFSSIISALIFRALFFVFMKNGLSQIPVNFVNYYYYSS